MEDKRSHEIDTTNVANVESINSAENLNDENAKKVIHKTRMSGITNAIKYLVAGMLIGFICALLLCYSVFNLGKEYSENKTSSKPEIDLMVLQERIVKSNELVAATYIYTNADKYEDNPSLLGLVNAPWLVGKSFVLLYDGEIKAGVNMSQIELEKQEDNGIVVKIPRPYIISHEIKEETVRVLEERETFFNSIKVEDIQAFRVSQKDAMAQRANERGLFELATENAKASLTTIIKAVVGDNVEISFQEIQQS